jgi:class 3 adenylate cyclase
MSPVRVDSAHESASASVDLLGEAACTQTELLEDVLSSLGVPPAAREQAGQSGDLATAFFEALPLRGAVDRTVTPQAIEGCGGMPVACVQELMAALGFPAPGATEPVFTPDEAHALAELWRCRDVWPFAATVQVARLYGRLLARIAQASAQQWFAVAEPLLRSVEPAEDRRAATAARTFDRLLPTADAFLTGVHRRWIEREAAQMAVRRAEAASTSELPVDFAEMSILFCDLKGFTAFTDRCGDSAAIRMIDRFATTVTRERGEEARLTKLLGDGFMLVYPEPALAVEAMLRIMATMHSTDQPAVHASVHHGAVVPWEGDYFGTSVNLAARLLAFADGDELLATAQVVERCPGFAWERVGNRRMRGVSGAVEVFRLGQCPQLRAEGPQPSSARK